MVGKMKIRKRDFSFVIFVRNFYSSQVFFYDLRNFSKGKVALVMILRKNRFSTKLSRIFFLLEIIGDILKNLNAQHSAACNFSTNSSSVRFGFLEFLND